MTDKEHLTISDADLEEEIRVIKAEIDSLEERLPRLENEAFYRKNPECRIGYHIDKITA